MKHLLVPLPTARFHEYQASKSLYSSSKSNCHKKYFFCTTTVELGLGQKMRRYRLLHGMTRRQLAQELDLDEGTLRSVETDERKHAAQTIKKIARLFKSLL